MKSRPHVLVVGGDSRLGAAIAHAHTLAGDAVSVTSRRTSAHATTTLDLAALPPSWRPPAGCDVAYLCAGVTSIQQCEIQPDLTARVNVQGTLALCRALADAGVRIVFFSTNLVFDGDSSHTHADAAFRPQCEYGRQKAQVESELASERIPSLVVRLTKVLEPSHALIGSWVKSLSGGEAIEPFTDMPMAPITLDEVVRTTIAATARGHRGILQLSAARDVSYLAAAQHVASRLGVAPDLVQPKTARATLRRGSFIPRYTSLAAVASAVVPFTPPEPWAAIDACLAAEANATLCPSA